MYIQDVISEQSGAVTTVVRTRHARFRTAFSLAALLLAAGCDPEATAPADFGSLKFLVVSGNGQSGVVGTELPQPLVVKATNPGGAPIADITVNFRVISGGGTVFAGSASTNNAGLATDYWTLGTSTDVAQTLEVRAVQPNGTKRVFGVFIATSLAGPAAQIVIQAGDGQTAGAATSVPIAPAVLVRDQYGNQVSGWAVTFAVASGGGSVTGGNATTSTSGIATVGSWTLGPAAGGNTLTATATGSGIAGNPVTFVATGVGDFWTTRASMTAARYSLGVAGINDILYAVSGLDANKALTPTVQTYDPATNTWTNKASIPTARSVLGVAALNGILYAIGGGNTSGVLGTVEAYDPATNAWTRKASMPTPRAGLGVAAINGILYAVGGIGGSINANSLTTVEAYDPITDRWTNKASIPTPRLALGVAVINGILYAVGGRDSIGSYLTTVEAYDPATDTWTTKAPMPTVRGFIGVAAINGSLYAVGGYDGAPPGYLGAVEAYDPTTETWTTKASMPTARRELGVAAINGILYAVGGIGQVISSTVEAYHP